MDIIFIRQLEIETIIGVYKHERDARQLIILDIEMQYDCQQAAYSDNLNYALDYHKLSNDVHAFASQTSFQLIEALANSIASFILKNKSIRQLKLTLSKPNALEKTTNVGIIINRTND